MVDLDAPIDHKWLFSHQDLMLVTRDGLGDQIVASGLANWMSQHVRRLYVTCRQSNWPTINWLYKNVHNVVPVGFPPGSNWSDLELLSKNLGAQLCRSIQLYHLRTGEPWFRSAYTQYHLDYNTRFAMWPNPDPGPSAVKLLERLVAQDHYMVVHNNSTEKASYDIDLLQGRAGQDIAHMQVIEIKPGITNNLFDWMLILQNAKEIHLVESSLFHMCQQISSTLKGQVYFHHIRDFSPHVFETDIHPYHPKWSWIEYPIKQWR